MKEETERFIKFICILILIIILFIGIAINATAGHEQIHKKIFARYDIKSKISIKGLGGRVDVINVSEYYKCNDACKTQHTLNDIISYEMDNLILTLFGLFFIYILYETWLGKNETFNKKI